MALPVGFPLSVSKISHEMRLPSVPRQARRGTDSATASHLASETLSTPFLPSTPPKFESDASILLIGMRGAGKSTLAVIASTALKRKVLDAETAFQETSGLSSLVFKKRHGPHEYQELQADVLRDLLRRNRKNAIIVCSWMERNVQGVLREFGYTNPIIYILRDAKAIQEHLKLSEDARVQDLLDGSASIFRGCTHFEFFNISENISKPESHTGSVAGNGDQRSPAPYLTLKRAERHFLKFLSLVLPEDSIPFIDSAFPLASLPPEDRKFTYAISMSLSTLLERDVDIEEIETGADAIELVVDDLVSNPSGEQSIPQFSARRAGEITKVIGQIRRTTVIPIFYHVILPDLAVTDGAWRHAYVSYLFHGLRLGVEYLSVDLRLDDDLLARVGALQRRPKLVGNVHWTGSDPPPWSDVVWSTLYRKGQKAGCNLVRMTRKALDVADNFNVRQIHAAVEDLGEPRIPLIVYNTGHKGRTSACFNQILTPVMPDGLEEASSQDEFEISYPRPSITTLQATQALYASFIYDPMKLYVFGRNVGYSLSPAMHNAALRGCGIPHVYKAHSTESISTIRDLVHDPHFGGASIGLPFKVEVISLTHSLSRHAKAIGAVNTLIPIRELKEDGSIPDDALLFSGQNRVGPVKALYGENTDWIGTRACIRRGLSPANAVRPSSSGLVIGAGGMARAAVYAMLQLGVKNILIFNRTYSNAENLVAHFSRLLDRKDLPLLSTESDTKTTFHVIKSRDEPWPEEFRFPTMVVSCIPTHSIGSTPAPDFTLPPQWLGSPTGGVVVELAYKTLDTPLLEQIRKEAHRGWVTMDGLDLLPDQGFAQFELFTGRHAPRRLMRREVFQAYPEEPGRSNLAQLQPRLNNVVEQEP